MKIYDISPEITKDMVVYKNKPQNRPNIKIIRTIKEGGIANESVFELYAHTGSHVDAPYHFLNKGATIEKLGLDRFIGKAIVLDLTKIKDKITKAHLENSKLKPQKNLIVLLKTKNKPDKGYNFDFAYLEKKGAAYLVSKEVKAVGLDSLSVERNQPNYDTHKILLKNNIPIFEGLDLSKVKQGRYFFHGLPLKIRKGDASPIRAVLIG